jgi:hypothetical protein
MNERIKELAEQAGFGAGQITDIDLPSEVRVIIALYANFDPEKFAELIVKESIVMCDELKAQYLTSRKSTMDFDEKHIYAEGEAACDIIKYKMKKQFGVE